METDKHECTLTPEQIENWRRVLLMTLGPYALIMPGEQIQKYRDMMQKKADTLVVDEKEES
jgi:hypothetical protein